MSPRPRAGGAGRVIAGTAKGRQLLPAGPGTRPLGDRLKEALFAILEPELRDRAFLDLFAGSGAAGIEALSRGASTAVFVERDAGAARILAANLAATGFADRASVVRADAIEWLGRQGPLEGPFAVVFADPPYPEPSLLSSTLRRIETQARARLLAGDGVVVLKHATKADVPAATALLTSVRERRFGETMLTFYRWADEVDA